MAVEGVGSSLDEFTKTRLKLFPIDIIICFIVLGCLMVVTTSIGIGSSIVHANFLLYIYEFFLLILCAAELYYTIIFYKDITLMEKVKVALSEYRTNWDKVKNFRARDLVWFAKDPEEGVLIFIIILLIFAIVTFLIMVSVLGLIVVRAQKSRRPRRQEEEVQMTSSPN